MNRINYKNWLLILVFTLAGTTIFSQDLMDMLNEDEPAKTDFTYATFKSTHLINGQTIELPPSGALNFVISHHFGAINSGAYEFFGLDQANIRFGFDYSFTDWLSVGIGRSSVNKTFDKCDPSPIENQTRQGKFPVIREYPFADRRK